MIGKMSLRVLFILSGFLIVLSFATPSHAAICAVGDKASVKWKGRWWPASVTDVRGNQCFIHYDGYDNSWDEWVGAGRIRVVSTSAGSPSSVAVGISNFPQGTAVMVLWKGSWWPASVLKEGNNRWYIHYDGYGSNWDEWVGPARIKRR